MKISCLVVFSAFGLAKSFITPSPSFLGHFLHKKDKECSSSSTPSLSVLHAKKRRRRRREGDSGEVGGEQESTPSGSTSMSELPDFDLEDDEAKESKPKKKLITNPDEVTPAMMGSADAPVGSLKDLLTDRSLEARFEFDSEEEDTSLPDLLVMARERDDVPGGKKKARQVERRAAAIASKESETENIFANLPFVSDEQGKIQPIKLLETGAWAGIFLLFGWEVYLNSPFFDRAAPLAPVVFENIVM